MNSPLPPRTTHEDGRRTPTRLPPQQDHPSQTAHPPGLSSPISTPNHTPTQHHHPHQHQQQHSINNNNNNNNKLQPQPTNNRAVSEHHPQCHLHPESITRLDRPQLHPGTLSADL
ncbi:hypothetical protein PGTUg99_000830 [Puccinia graminis f. sp. tritici]|uniref:Uncharacterized protein n=1 Tax=Puccinia graminis f. sp. tritici TaxID=56615 RepID=A0A5B0MS21_PUCGR|nr:hypothetical protein PGTUg99_000830 [Puccinia graminis f. sp. tritici]